MLAQRSDIAIIHTLCVCRVFEDHVRKYLDSSMIVTGPSASHISWNVVSSLDDSSPITEKYMSTHTYSLPVRNGLQINFSMEMFEHHCR